MVQVPASVVRGLHVRLREGEGQRTQVLSAVRAQRPLEAEPERERLIGRIQRATGVGREVAMRLAKNEEPSRLGLRGDARLGAERIQGRTRDFVGVSFLEVARAAATTVGRVVFRNLSPQGSGFLVSDRLFLTNNHVIKSVADAASFLVEFNYELDADQRAKPVTRFELAPQVCFISSAADELDFTLVALSERGAGPGRLSEFGFCPLLGSPDKHVLGEFVNIIQHPAGDYKQVVLRENRLVTRLPKVLHYLSDTQPGSSGSPVFNDQWEAVALHHWGEPFTEVTGPDGKPVQQDVNEGIRISAIVKALEDRLLSLRGDARRLVEAAIRPPFRHPSTIGGERRYLPLHETTPEGSLPVIGANGSATWIVPVEISVRLPSVTAGPPVVNQPPEPPAVVPGDGVAGGEKISVDRDYSKRRGYNPKFLPGHTVPLPRLSEAQKAKAARLLNPTPGANPFELKYQHFSLALNSDRRMAFYTAANLDGSSWIHIKRETGEPMEAAEATEEWFDEPRIASEAQCEQSLYDNQKPSRVFDRGHLVRRQDPAWGTRARAKRANADTYHFTNCTPQQWRFNQQVTYWQGIEEYVLDNATAEGERVSVFTGPVLDDDDTPYRYVKVPKQFWKILARVEDGELLSTALIADQTGLITTYPERLSEGFDDLGTVAEYQTSVRNIEELTGLDFGPLRDADTFSGGGEAIEGDRRRLRSFADLSLERSMSRVSSRPGSNDRSTRGKTRTARAR